MISAHPHAARECLWPTRPNQAPRDLPLSSGVLFERQPEGAVQAETASPARREKKLGLPTLQRSKFHHVNGSDANGHAGLTVDQVAANLAALANGIVAGLTLGGRFVAALRTIGKAGNDGEGLRHGLHAGNQGCALMAHSKISVSGDFTIGPMVLSSQEVIAA